MKLLMITDIHSNPDLIFKYLDNNSVDGIIITGDVTEFGPEDYFLELLNKFSTFANVYAIFGNCDPINASDLIDKSDATNIHNNVSFLENITLVGFGGSNPTPFDTPNEFDEEILYEKLSIFNGELSSENYTILVTHAPPINTNADMIESGAHVGSSSVRKIIEECQPTLNVCGHVHESVGMDKIGNTVVVNPGDAASGHACLITITDDDITNKNVNVELITIGE